MYKIILKGIATNGVVNWSFYKEFGQEFVTSSVTAATAKYRELLNTYGMNNLKLVNDINLDVTISVGNEPQNLVTITSATIVNNGTDFNISFINDTGNYVWVDYNNEIYTKLEDFLLSVGLTDIKISMVDGVSANNTTGSAVTGEFLLPEGLLIAYDKTNKTVNNISSEYQITLS